AQAEHGDDGQLALIAVDPALVDRVAELVERIVAERPSVASAQLSLVAAPGMEAALAFADAFAPEHLELVGPQAERLAPRVRAAGCVFVGSAGATAFGDYVAGSNHCLPTGGAARFASGLSPRHFRRRVSEVHVGSAVAPLARAGVPIARAEGFAVHAESMRARVRENDRP
ncbi:MAG: histidinol dehydrogenase, partial [Actinomycetota bacterium]|nr:histidinol dehydrogenase [Actinomycetota bacterium]